MLSSPNLKAKPRIFRSLSGLSLAELNRLLPKFEQAWQEHLANEYIYRDQEEGNDGEE